jgi:hypothetical protein
MEEARMRARNGWWVVAVVVTMGAACSSGGDEEAPRPLAQDLCERADQCNLLGAGYSAAECTSDIGACVRSLSDAQRHDWETFIDECMRLQVCQSFDDCYWTVPWC